jgi:hypothetical protein
LTVRPVDELPRLATYLLSIADRPELLVIDRRRWREKSRNGQRVALPWGLIIAWIGQNPVRRLKFAWFQRFLP